MGERRAAAKAAAAAASRCEEDSEPATKECNGAETCDSEASGSEAACEERTEEECVPEAEAAADVEAEGDDPKAAADEPESCAIVEQVVNAVEWVTNIDLDGDGDVGLAGRPEEATSEATSEASDAASDAAGEAEAEPQSFLERVVNAVEWVTNIDLDGDGDVGLAGQPAVANGAAERPTCGAAAGASTQLIWGKQSVDALEDEPSPTEVYAPLATPPVTQLVTFHEAVIRSHSKTAIGASPAKLERKPSFSRSSSIAVHAVAATNEWSEVLAPTPPAAASKEPSITSISSNSSPRAWKPAAMASCSRNEALIRI